jgi:hypothetical protein
MGVFGNRGRVVCVGVWRVYREGFGWFYRDQGGLDLGLVVFVQFKGVLVCLPGRLKGFRVMFVLDQTFG